MDVNQYAKVFVNNAYFAKLYPINSKKKGGDALKLFYKEFGVPEKIISMVIRNMHLWVPHL